MESEQLIALVTAGAGVLIAASSYTMRSLHSWWAERQRIRRETEANLQQLASLIRTSKSLFDFQRTLNMRLLAMLESNHPGQVRHGEGFEENFAQLKDAFSDEEDALHGMIRSITEKGLAPVNRAVSEWLAKDNVFKTAKSPLKNPDELANWLHQLDLHLRLWHAKYEYWMPDPRHALVYLADEQRHGTRFPTGIENKVDEALTELGQPSIATLPVPN